MSVPGTSTTGRQDHEEAEEEIAGVCVCVRGREREEVSSCKVSPFNVLSIDRYIHGLIIIIML